MNKSYRFLIYPNSIQAELIQKTFGCRRWVYNYFLSERIEAYKKTGLKIGRFEQDKHLTILKKEFRWLREPDKCALQSAIVDLEKAYQNFFRRISVGKTPGFPKFKSKHSRHQSYRTSGLVRVFASCVQLPKLGLVPLLLNIREVIHNVH